MLKGVFVLLFLPVLLYAQEWKRVESGVADDLYDVFFVNKDVGWAVGNDSTIIKSTDGGKTWKRQESGASADYRAIWFNDELNGWVVGITAHAPYMGIIIATTDGGKSWTEQTRGTNFFEDIQFTSTNTGYSVVLRGAGVIMKTTNSGQDWAVLGSEVLMAYPGGGFKGLSFIDNDHGWICGGTSFFDNLENELLFHTTDGGITWIQQDSPHRVGPLSDIHFVDSLLGFAGGRGPGIKTTNSGNEWGNFQLAELTAMSVVNENFIYAACMYPTDPGVYETRDGGSHWIKMTIENRNVIYGMFAIDTIHAYAVGLGGGIWVKHMTTGIEANPEIPEPAQCEVYPNPVGVLSGNGAQTNIRFSPSGNHDVSFTLWNALGREIDVMQYTHAQSSAGYTLDVSRLRNGVYFFRFIGGGAAGKFVVRNN